MWRVRRRMPERDPEVTAKRGRPTLSVSGALYRRIAAYSEATGVPRSRFVEQLLEPVLSGVDAIPASIRLLPTADADAEPPAVDRRTQIERVLAAVAAAPADAGLSARVPILLSPEVIELIDDQCDRAIEAGIFVMPSQVLDGAINRMLDLLEALPPDSICGRCGGQPLSSARRLPIGSAGAMMPVCWDCDVEHPRKAAR